MEGSYGTDILEIRFCVCVLSWQWDLVKDGCRGKEYFLILVWKGHNLEELNVKYFPIMYFLDWVGHILVWFTVGT